MTDKPLPHPPYSEKSILPKTKYGVPVRREQFENNDFLFRGRDESFYDDPRYVQKPFFSLEAAMEKYKKEEEEKSRHAPQSDNTEPARATKSPALDESPAKMTEIWAEVKSTMTLEEAEAEQEKREEREKKKSGDWRKKLGLKK